MVGERLISDERRSESVLLKAGRVVLLLALLYVLISCLPTAEGK